MSILSDLVFVDTVCLPMTMTGTEACVVCSVRLRQRIPVPVMSVAAVAGATECVVSTFVGSQEAGTMDGIGIAARLNEPSNLCLSMAGNSLFVIESTRLIRRVYLAATRESRAALFQSITVGIAGVSVELSAIPPLIDLVIAYGLTTDGMTTSDTQRDVFCHVLTRGCVSHPIPSR